MIPHIGHATSVYCVTKSYGVLVLLCIPVYHSCLSVFNQLSYTELLIKLMNSQNFSLNSHLLKFVSLCNDLRNNLLSNHADDT